METTLKRALEWCSKYSGPPLAEDLVPGTTVDERSRLAALGGLARALGGGYVSQWPEPVQLWAEQGKDVPGDLQSEVRAALLAGRDLLADIYSSCVLPVNRRKLGTFFTPSCVVDLMLNISASMLGTSPKIVVDPGAGVGAFSLRAKSRWRTSQIYSVDLNAVTLGLLAAHQAVKGTQGIHLVFDDYLNWIQSPCFSSDSGPKLIIGNPPYTRHQSLTEKQKREAQKPVAELVDSQLASLCAYFMASSIKSLEREDGMCLLLPANWTEARYGKKVREWIWQSTDRRVAIYTFPLNYQVFPGTHVAATILGIGPSKRKTKVLTASSVRMRKDGTARVGRERPRSRDRKCPEDYGSWLWPQPRRPKAEGTPLSKLATVRRGVATGANSLFFLTDQVSSMLPAEVTRAAIHRLWPLSGQVLDHTAHDKLGSLGERRWLLRLQGEQDLKHASIQKLISDAETKGVHLGYLTSARSPWYVLEKVEPPSILIGSMGRATLRVVRNKIKAIPSNSIYGIYIQSKDLSDSVCDWLNSKDGQDELRGYARHYAGGLLKLEPKDLLKLVIPATALK